MPTYWFKHEPKAGRREHIRAGFLSPEMCLCISVLLCNEKKITFELLKYIWCTAFRFPHDGSNSFRLPLGSPEGIYSRASGGLVACACHIYSFLWVGQEYEKSSQQVFPGIQVEFWKARSKAVLSTCYNGAMENMIILIASLIELEITEAISKAQL